MFAIRPKSKAPEPFRQASTYHVSGHTFGALCHFGRLSHGHRFAFVIAVGTLEETLKLSEAEFKERFGRDKPTDDTAIIFSCKLGGRATKAAEIAIALGFENSRIFKGSWTEWAAHKDLWRWSAGGSRTDGNPNGRTLAYLTNHVHVHIPARRWLFQRSELTRAADSDNNTLCFCCNLSKSRSNKILYQ